MTLAGERNLQSLPCLARALVAPDEHRPLRSDEDEELARARIVIMFLVPFSDEVRSFDVSRDISA